jgi:pimeloyl-ACP methyl ester carboxylesterase
MTSVSRRQDDAGAAASTGAWPLPDVPGVTHRFVAARGARFHVAQAGAGDPVVLLHGLPRLARGHSRTRRRVPAVRGCGWSQATPRGTAPASRPWTSWPSWTPSASTGSG